VSAETENLLENQTVENNAPVSMKAATRAYAGQKNPDKPGIDEKQIEQYLPLVHKIAQRAAVYLKPPLTYEDLISAGTVGLVKAARDFDPSFQAEFKTYAYIRIRGAILDELRGWAFIPPTVNKQIRRTMDLCVEIKKQTGTAPTETEIAEKLGLSVDEVFQTFDSARSQQFISIHGFGEDSPSLANILAAPQTQTPDEQIEHTELIDRLTKAIQSLEQRQREVIVLYYQQHLNMKQIAEVFKVTEPRVSQIHAAALFSLQTQLRQYEDAGQ
jgi:RNA polymerase sigma factor FliA